MVFNRLSGALCKKISNPRTDEDGDDPLAPASGAMAGAVLGAMIWATIAVVIWRLI